MKSLPVLALSLLFFAACATSMPSPAPAEEEETGFSTSAAVRHDDVPGLEKDGDGRVVVRIVPDWKTHYPYSERFAVKHATAVTAVPGRLIDLEAIAFLTEPLVISGSDGERQFADPDLTSFPRDLIGSPFASGDEDFFIVQARDEASQSTLRRHLEERNIQILDYIPHLAYLVRATAAEIGGIKARPDVFWVGYYHPAYRIDPKLDYVTRVNPTHDLLMTAQFDNRRTGNLDALRSSIRARGLTIAHEAAHKGRLYLRLRGPALQSRAVATLAAALWIERHVDAELHNNVARTSSSVETGRGSTAGPIMDVEDVWARGIRGEGQIAAAADTGLSTGNLTTPGSLHWDFGYAGSTTNPMRVIKCYALGRLKQGKTPATCDDNQSTGGGHGTHTSGSIVGNGIRSGSNPSTNAFPATSHAGTAPKAQFVFQSIMDSRGGLGGIPSPLYNLFAPPYADGARIHSNSWGAPVAGDYNANAQSADDFVWDNKDMVITFSAGNSGKDTTAADGIIDTDSIGAPGTAKNVITVGASENYRPTFVYEYPENDCVGDGFTQQAWGWFNGSNFGVNPIRTDLMANNASGMGAFSSRGPTNDGRIKPDIVAPGIAIISTRTNLNQAYEQWGICNVESTLRTHYLTQGGTSMSNPLTAGAATLVRQYFVDGWHANNSVVTNTAAVPSHGFNPSAALVKAILINGAWDMTPGQYGTGATKELPAGWEPAKTIPNNAMGFGRVDLERSLFPGYGWGDDPNRVLEVRDVSTGLTTGQSATYTFTVANANDPLVVTLVWTDPYGALSAATELVNDLDLTVTDGTTTWYANAVNNTTATLDVKNNVEQVYISLPAAATYTIRVNARNVPGNAEAGSNVQPYALVISGVMAPPCTPPGVPQNVTATGTGANQVTVSWSPAVSGATGYKVYRSDGACPGGAFALVGTIASASTLSFVDTTVTGGSTYSYKVTSYAACESAFSACASATAPFCTTPEPPSGLTLSTPANNTIQLDWTASVTASVTYNVYRTDGACAAGTFSLVGSGLTATTWSDTSVVGGSTYAYVVTAAVSTCESAATACASTTATGGPGVYSASRRAAGAPQNTSLGQTVRWKYNSGATLLAPLTISGAIFTGANDRLVHAMNLTAAGGNWPRSPAPRDWHPPAMNAPAQSRAPILDVTTYPIMGVTRVTFVSSQDGRLYCFNANNGALLWSTGVLGDMLQASPGMIFRQYGSKLTGMDLLIVGTRNSSAANSLYAINAADGTTVWTYTHPDGIGPILAMPTPDVALQRIYFTTRAGGSANTVWALDYIQTGWSLRWAAAAGDSETTPWRRGTRVFVGNNTGQVMAFEGGASGTPAPTWTFSTNDGPVKSFVIADRASTNVYFSTTNRVWSVAEGSGAETWKSDGIANPSAPTMRGTELWVGASNGDLVKLTGINTSSPAVTHLTLGGGVVGSPSVDFQNNLIHVGTEAGTVYAVTP